MNPYFITFRSVTVAQRGEDALRRMGIACTLQRTPRWMQERGCGYCLRLREQDVMDAADQLRANRVPISKIYRQTAGGRVEEAAL